MAEFDDDVTEELQRRATDENGKTILVTQNITYQQWEKQYKPNLILNQGSINSKRQKMNWQEQNEILESRIIKPKLHFNKSTSYRINKYQDKIMELYRNNGNENMCILDLKSGNLIGNITNGKDKITVGLNTKTMIKMLTRPSNSIIMIHNHPINYSFSLMDIKTFNRIKQVDTMILLTDDYKFYLNRGNKKIDPNYIEKIYRKIENDIRKKYNALNGAERRDLTNQEFFKEVGWIYEKEKN